MHFKTPFNALVKIICSLAILAVLFHQIHLKEVLPYLKNIHTTPFIAAILFVLGGNLIAIYRWVVIIKTLKMPTATVFYLKTYFVGVMFNQLLPSSIGGDAYRMFEITKLNIPKRLAITSVLADRLIGFLGLILLSVATLPVAHSLLPERIFLGVTLLLFACCSAVISLYFLNTLRIALFEKKLRWLYDLSNTLNASSSSFADLLKKIALSVLTNLSSSISFYFIAVALNVPCHILSFMIIIPLVTLLMMIPLSMAGWGIREGAMVYFGAMIGLSQPAALAISLLSGLILIINSLPGFCGYFTKKKWVVQDSNLRPTG